MICVSMETAEWCDTAWDLLLFLGCGLNTVPVLVTPLESCFVCMSLFFVFIFILLLIYSVYVYATPHVLLFGFCVR